MARTLFIFVITLSISLSSWAWGWPADYKPMKQRTAFEVAKSNNKPIAIYYSLSYCPGCRILESQLRDSKIYEAWADKMNFVSIDPGADLDQAERNKIKAEWGQIITPTMTFFSARGQYICFTRGTWKDTNHGQMIATRLLPLLTQANESPTPRSCAEILWKKNQS